jgi:tryptophan halogenase
MNIVIVGGGTAGWITAMMAAKRHPAHSITVIESSKIGIVGVGESTTGRMTDLLMNFYDDYGCDINEFIVETGATLKYGINHKGWTNNIDQSYFGPIDGSWTHASTPDPIFSWALAKLPHNRLLTTARCGYWIDNKMSTFNKYENSFLTPNHAMHVDAHLVGEYFKRKCLVNPNARHIDTEVQAVELDSITGNIKSVKLQTGETVHGDFFIDCTGFSKVLMKELDTKWISYRDNLPLNTAIPFWIDYKKDETPDIATVAWAQKNGWMWQLPLMDRKGCGYIFDDRFTTPEKAQEEVESILGHSIDIRKVIKFDSGRQEAAWVKNCVAIGLSSAFLEPLEATSIHSTIVQAQMFIHQYVKPTIEETLNNGARNIHNQRVRNMYDDIKDFLVMHYMGGRNDSEFWKYVSSGVTQTEYVSNLLELAKTGVPNAHEFPSYQGSAGWPLYSFVMAGLGLLNKDVALAGLNFELPFNGSCEIAAAHAYYELQDTWKEDAKSCYSYEEFITYFRELRFKNGFSNKQY